MLFLRDVLAVIPLIPHRYERSWPVRNRVPIKTLHRPGAPVYVVEGAAGDVEGIISVVTDVPWRCAWIVEVVCFSGGNNKSLCSLLLDATFPCAHLYAHSAAHVKGFETGYGRIVANATALTYTHVDARTQNVGDRFTLTK
jgi:hypothetical protein